MINKSSGNLLQARVGLQKITIFGLSHILLSHKLVFERKSLRSHAYSCDACCRTSNANQTVQELVRTLLETLNHLSLEAIISNGQDISHHLRQAVSYFGYITCIHSLYDLNFHLYSYILTPCVCPWKNCKKAFSP